RGRDGGGDAGRTAADDQDIRSQPDPVTTVHAFLPDFRYGTGISVVYRYGRHGGLSTASCWHREFPRLRTRGTGPCRRSSMSTKTASMSQADAAYCRVEEMIVTRVLAPGQMISEKRSSDDLGCGRTPSREASQRSKLEGYVEIHASRGISVAPIDVVRQLDLLEVRRSLEDLMVRLG
ncbi:hypothetical protein OY671_010441, partial [Metschnikowia pulcherrima]